MNDHACILIWDALHAYMYSIWDIILSHNIPYAYGPIYAYGAEHAWAGAHMARHRLIATYGNHDALAIFAKLKSVW